MLTNNLLLTFFAEQINSEIIIFKMISANDIESVVNILLSSVASAMYVKFLIFAIDEYEMRK